MAGRGYVDTQSAARPYGRIVSPGCGVKRIVRGPTSRCGTPSFAGFTAGSHCRAAEPNKGGDVCSAVPGPQAPARATGPAWRNTMTDDSRSNSQVNPALDRVLSECIE